MYLTIFDSEGYMRMFGFKMIELIILVIYKIGFFLFQEHSI